jgi:hypothetical protein
VADRDKYRDNDDLRGVERERSDVRPDTKSEARGDARETVGNNARGTDAHPVGPEWNDGQKGRPRPDEFDAELDRDARTQPRNDEITES